MLNLWRQTMTRSQRRVCRYGALGLGLVAAASQLVSQSATTSVVDFKKDVQPILKQNCAVCHAGDSAVAGLHLDSGQGILAGSANGKVVVAGSAKDSLLIQRVVEKSMPPTGPLSDDQIAVLRTWVDQGAKTGEAVSTANPPASQTAGKPTASASHAKSAAELAKMSPAAATEQKLLDQYCVSCHSATNKLGGLAMDKLDVTHVEKDAAVWERIVRKMRAGMMPQVGAPRPDAKTFESIITYVEGELDKRVAVQLPQPGLHRLNRAEYSNAIRDVLGLDVDASKFLPSDDSTHGFDNQAGTLTASPALIEAYRSAAGKIARVAVGDVKTPTQTPYRVPEDTSQDYHIEGLPFGTRGGLVVTHDFPADGEYEIKVWPVNLGNMDNNQAFGGVSGEKLEFLLDGERLHTYEWDRELRAGAAIHGGTAPFRFTAKGGPHKVGVTFLATNYSPNTADLNRHFLRSTIETGGIAGYTFYPHVGYIRIDGPFNAKGATESPSRRKIFVCNPTSPAQETACARQIVSTLGRHAYRRAVTESDVESLLGFYQRGRNEGGDFEHGVEMAIQAILMDPDFIFRKEAEPANISSGAKYRISDVELASRLSFFLWSSVPDETLLNLATQHKLSNPVVLDQQVRRMMADSRSKAFIENFGGQWFNVRGLEGRAPVTQAFPDFDDNLRNAFQKEAELFFGSIVQEDRSLLDLIDANYTYVNERLAKHYGIPNVYGSDFRRVTLTPDLDMRRGLLGKGFFLEISAQPDRTSPVGRGKSVMAVFLGVSPPDPPPGVVIKLVSTDSDVHGAAKPSMRQQMEMHRKNEPCATCHKIMDPIGFALENFDAIGAWRTQDAGNPIDATGYLVDGSKLDGLKGLRDALTRYSPQFVRVATEHLMTYALGRGVEYYDMPTLRSIVRSSAKDNYRFSSLILGVVKSEQFQMNMKGLTYGVEAAGQ
jgi:mono/diheme cytochrome c family protein